MADGFINTIQNSTRDRVEMQKESQLSGLPRKLNGKEEREGHGK
jgi:hypothetical protein